MHARNSFENKIFRIRIIKTNVKKLTRVFLFMDKIAINRSSMELVTSLFRLQNMFRNIYFLAIYHLGNFDDFIQSAFLVIPNISFANLCEPIHNIIIKGREKIQKI